MALSEMQPKMRMAMTFFIAIVAAGIYSLVTEMIGKAFPATADGLQLFGHVLITIAVIFIVHAVDADAMQTRATLAYEKALRDATSEYQNLLQEHFPLGLNATACGLVSIHQSREAANAEVTKALKNAKSKVLLLGVAFRETLQIPSFLQHLAKKMAEDPRFDCRMLLLNPLTSPAVFRAFLETPAGQAKKYLEHQKIRLTSGEEIRPSYTSSQLYTDCHLIYQSLANLPRHIFGKHVKFYRRDPTVWMVLVDDRVFVESYTFGRSDEQQLEPINLRLGGHMPVFEFRGEDSAPYKILTDHFQRLWETSTDDLLHMGAMYSDVEKYLDEHVFSPRLPWLSVVVEALGQKEKRSSPRRMYDFPVILKTTDTAQTWNARLKDCSSGGARLECEMPGPDSDFHLTAGAEVAVSVDSQMANPQTRFFRENLFEEENTQYRIEDVRKNGDMTKPRYDVRIKRAA